MTREDSLEWLPIKDVMFDYGPSMGTGYQRPPNQRQVDEIARDFDPDKIGVLHASRRADGKLWVIDGQQRILAMRKLEWWDEAPFRIYEGITRQKEAELFVALNGARTDVQRVYLFNGRVLAGDHDAIEVHRVLTSHGLLVRFGPAVGNVSAISSIEQIYHVTSAEMLDRILSLAIEAWGKKTESFQGDLLKGIAYMFTNYPTTLDEKRLLKILSKHTPSQYVSRARGLRALESMTVPTAIARIIRSDYNSRNASPLPELNTKGWNLGVHLRDIQHGVEKKKRGTVPAETIEAVRLLMQEKLGYEEMGKRLGISKTKVKQITERIHKEKREEK